MDELPELPFELVLSYLSLEDRLKARAVSRRWYHQINRFKVNTLCYSQHLPVFIYGKMKQNFINSQRFTMFFNTFRPTILSNLKHLRLCDLRLNKKTRKSFPRTLQSFGQLEQLDIIGCRYHTRPGVEMKLELSLPMLAVIQLEGMNVISKLTLDSPRLRKIIFYSCIIKGLELVHTESVEWLMVSRGWSAIAAIAVKKLKNLKYLYADLFSIDPTFLSSLEQLREIHLRLLANGLLERLFEQKQRHGRTDLKIYFTGLLLNGPEDPAIGPLRQAVLSHDFDEEAFGHLAENPSRLADQIPFWYHLYYSRIERVAPGSEMSVLKRFTHLSRIIVYEPVVDTDRFLNLLKNLDNIECLKFECDQPKGLFDRLPEHCANPRLNSLYIYCELSDYRFLFRLKHMTELSVSFSIDAEAIRKIFKQNEFLSRFRFKYLNKWAEIEIEHPRHYIKVEFNFVCKEVPGLGAAIEFITGESKHAKGWPPLPVALLD